MTTPQLTARLRGGGCGVLVGGLAVAAHGIGGGPVPRSAEIALLLMVSLAAGMFAHGAGPRATPRRPQTLRTALALIGGQWAGHFALSATLDHHGLLHLPGPAMIAAHLVAACACAALILVAERLYLVASRVVRAVLGKPRAVVHRAARWFVTVAVVRGARPRGARCPRAPPVFA
ncbi:hypothetical protein [Nocardia alba]|uniref:hypothetical protein n=1 Tax=Nocardia alba TaxID=225051 RepID=UPI00083568B9|nr:hypothetical protein [Nocardia alba]